MSLQSQEKASALTPDNADKVLSSCLDIRHLMEHLNNEPNIFLDEEALIAAIKQCVKDPKTVHFSSITQQHLELLGLNVVLDLELDPTLVETMNHMDSPSNRIAHNDILSYFHKHFNVSKEFGCCCIIYQYLITSVLYAQDILDKDPKMMESVSSRFGVKNPQLAVFMDVPIPRTHITHKNTSYTFHGLLDYGIGFIKGPSLRRGSLRLNPTKILSGVLEASTLVEMQNAESQMMVQVLTILTLTGRKFFTGALTNGALWRFYVAHFENDQLKIFSSAELATDTDQGLIVELIKDMMLYEISPLFTNFA